MTYTATRTGLSQHHKQLLATTIENLSDVDFTVTPDEIKRACLNDGTVWVEFFQGGRIAFPLQALAQTMNEYESEGIAQPEEAVEVSTKLAENLEPGDIIILNGEKREVVSNFRHENYVPSWHSTVRVIEFRVIHAPADFKYEEFKGDAYSQAYWEDCDRQLKNYRDSMKTQVFVGSDALLWAGKVEKVELDLDEYLKGW